MTEFPTLQVIERAAMRIFSTSAAPDRPVRSVVAAGHCGPPMRRSALVVAGERRAVLRGQTSFHPIPPDPAGTTLLPRSSDLHFLVAGAG